MASVTLNIPNGDIPDVFAAYTEAWMVEAVRLFYGGSQAAYEADTMAARGAALLKASIVVTTRNYRTQQNLQSAMRDAAQGTEPAVT